MEDHIASNIIGVDSEDITEETHTKRLSSSPVSLMDISENSAHQITCRNVCSVLHEISAMALCQLYDQVVPLQSSNNNHDWMSMVEKSYTFTNRVMDKWIRNLKKYHQQHDSANASGNKDNIQVVDWMRQIQRRGRFLENKSQQYYDELNLDQESMLDTLGVDTNQKSNGNNYDLHNDDSHTFSKNAPKNSNENNDSTNNSRKSISFDTCSVTDSRVHQRNKHLDVETNLKKHGQNIHQNNMSTVYNLSKLGNVDPCHLLSLNETHNVNTELSHNKILGRPPTRFLIDDGNKITSALKVMEQLLDPGFPSYWMYDMSLIDKACRVVTQRLHHVTLTGRPRQKDHNNGCNNKISKNIELFIKSYDTTTPAVARKEDIEPINFLGTRLTEVMNRRKRKKSDNEDHSNFDKHRHQSHHQNSIRVKNQSLSSQACGRPPSAISSTRLSIDENDGSLFLSSKDKSGLEKEMIHEKRVDKNFNIVQGALKNLGSIHYWEYKKRFSRNHSETDTVSLTLRKAKNQRLHRAKVEKSNNKNGNSKVKWSSKPIMDPNDNASINLQERCMELDLGECTVDIITSNNINDLSDFDHHSRHKKRKLMFRSLEISLVESKVENDE